MHTRDYVTKQGRRADYVAKQGRRASIKKGEGIRGGGGREQEEMREIVKWQSNPKMHRKDTVIVTLEANPEQVEIQSCLRGGVTRPPRFLFCSKKESKAAGKQSRHKGSKMRRKCVGNKVAGMFSCGQQRDLCHLSEAQPQAGNKVRSKIWDKEKEQHKQEMGQRGRNNA